MLTAAALLLSLQSYVIEVKVTTREETMTRCLTQSRQHPRGKYYDWDGGWDIYYRQCMLNAGYVP